jgi:hypothetical protein
MLDINKYAYNNKNVKLSAKIRLIGRITINRLAVPCMSAKRIPFFTTLGYICFSYFFFKKADGNDE